MNPLLLLVALVVLASIPSIPCGAEANCEDPFDDPNQILELHIQTNRADWLALRNSDLVGSGCDAQYPYYQVGFRCGANEEWISIGVRRKRGDQRGKDTNEKPPIKLDFNRFEAGQRWPAARGALGYRKLSLNNGQPDNPGGLATAILSEHLAWRLMKREVPLASGIAYARLNVHFTDDDLVEYHGLYLLLEDIDRTAIRARFGDAAGTLLKTTTGSCRNQVVFDDGLPNQALERITSWLDLDPDDFPDDWMSQSDAALNLEDTLRQEALRDVLANQRDTLLGQNYSNFLSWDSQAGKRHYLPWDLDDAFRPYPQDGPFNTPLESSCSEIGTKTRCHDETRQRYLEIACQLANGTLAEERLLSEYDAIDAMIRPLLAEEVDLVWPDKDPLDLALEGSYAWEYLRMRQWIEDRIPFIREHITAEGFDCPDGCPVGASEPCMVFACEGERRCDDKRWTTCEVERSDESVNSIDDDCDGIVDEHPVMGPDAGIVEGDASLEAEKSGGGGCGCQINPGKSTAPLWCVANLLLWRRRCASLHPSPDAGSGPTASGGLMIFGLVAQIWTGSRGSLRR